MTMLERFEKLDIDVLNQYRQTGISKSIPDDLQRYIIHIFRALELFTLQGNISNCARNLIKEFSNELKNFATARKLIYDAINHFHVNEHIKNEVWNTLYADKMDSIALLAINNDDYKSAVLAYNSAHKFRTMSDESKIDPEMLKPPVYIITSDITHKELDIEKRDLKQIARKVSDGFYAKMINNLPVDENEKIKLRKDANIDYYDFEEIER